MSNETKLYPPEIVEAAAHDAPHQCVEIELSNCVVPSCWFQRLKESSITIYLNPTSMITAMVNGSKFTYGKVYPCTEYAAYRREKDRKIVLAVTVLDDASKPYTTDLTESVGSFTICADKLAAAFIHHLVSSQSFRVTKLKEVLARWVGPHPEFKIDDVVKIKKNMLISSTGPDDVYVISELGETNSMFNQACRYLRDVGVFETFNCLLASLDKDGDLTFTPNHTNRLEHVKIESNEIETL